MPSLDEIHEEVRSKLNEIQRIRQSHLITLGEELSAVKNPGAWSEAYAKQLSAIKDLRAALLDKKQTFDRWQALERKLETIKEERKSLDLERERLRQELDGHFEDIGVAAVELYKQSALSFNETSELLTDVQQLDVGIREKEKELRQLESAPAPASFFGRTVNKGRGFVLRGSLKSRELQRVKRLKLVGERMCEYADPSAFPEDSSLSRRMASIDGSVDDFRRVCGRIKEIELDRIQVNEERSEIERNARMRNPVKNLEYEMKRLEFELSGQLRELGNQFCTSDAGKTTVNDKVSKTVAVIERSERERTRYEKLLVRVEAGLAIETLEKQKKKLGGEIAALNLKIKELEERIAEIDKEISGNAALRGNPDTLKMPEKKVTAAEKKENNPTSGHIEKPPFVRASRSEAFTL